MPKKNKIIVLAMTLIIIALVAAQCGAEDITEPVAVATAPPTAVAGLELPDLSGQTLDILTWDGYAPDELVTAFEEATGVTINITYVEGNGELNEKLKTEKHGWDIAQPTLDRLALAQEVDNLYQPIQAEKVTNLDKVITPLNRGVAKYATLGGIQYALPFTWGVTGIAVNTAKVKEPITSYSQLCDPAYAGYVTYRNTYPAFIVAAYGRGNDLYAAANDIAEWRRIMEDALEYMIECDPNVTKYWETRQESIDMLTNEEVYLAEAWDGTGWLLSEQNPDFKFIVPEEGGLGWIDTLAIPAQADNLEAAYAWINYMYEPENAGKLAESSGYGPVVKNALDFIPEARAALISESLPPEVIENINWSPSLLPQFQDINVEMEKALQSAIEKNK